MPEVSPASASGATPLPVGFKPTPCAVPHTEVPGLVLIEEFVSEEEEAELRAEIDLGDWESSVKRRVQHHGYAFNYQTLKHDLTAPVGPLPEYALKILARCADRGYETALECGQLTLNEYPPGVGIAYHCDTHSAFEDDLYVLSLGASIVLEFRQKDRKCPILVPPRSLLIMTGESRFGWKHGIASRTTDQDANGELMRRTGIRVSLTFRRVRAVQECHCVWPELCDTQNPTSLQLPTRLEPKPKTRKRGDDRKKEGPKGMES